MPSPTSVRGEIEGHPYHRDINAFGIGPVWQPHECGKTREPGNLKRICRPKRRVADVHRKILRGPPVNLTAPLESRPCAKRELMFALRWTFDLDQCSSIWSSDRP